MTFTYDIACASISRLGHVNRVLLTHVVLIATADGGHHLMFTSCVIRLIERWL